MDVGPSELIIVLVIILVLFGGAKLPKLAKSLGEAQREFKRGTAGHTDDAEPEAKPVETTVVETKVVEIPAEATPAGSEPVSAVAPTPVVEAPSEPTAG